MSRVRYLRRRTTGSCVVTPKAVDCGDAVCSEDPASRRDLRQLASTTTAMVRSTATTPNACRTPTVSASAPATRKKRGAGVAKCQSVDPEAAGVRLATVTRVRLQQCADARVPLRPAEGGRSDVSHARRAPAAIKQATALADGPGSLSGTAPASRSRRAVARRRPACRRGCPATTSAAATGLGFLGELTACDDPNTPAAGVLDRDHRSSRARGALPHCGALHGEHATRRRAARRSATST